MTEEDKDYIELLERTIIEQRRHWIGMWIVLFVFFVLATIAWLRFLYPSQDIDDWYPRELSWTHRPNLHSSPSSPRC